MISSGGGYKLTSLVSAEHFRDPISDVPCKGAAQEEQSLWEIFDAKVIGFKPEGNAPESKFLRLKAAVNWYLYELGHFFRNPVAFTPYHKRSWYVYSDLVQTQMVVVRKQIC